MRKKLVLGLLIGVILGLAATVTVTAHANLVRSIPASGEVLAAPPQTVTIWFSEAPQAGFSTIDVFDQNLHEVDRKDSAIVPQDAFQMRVTLPSGLPNGTYTVRWSAVSATDGHHTIGAFAFSVGVPGDRHASTVGGMVMDGSGGAASDADPFEAVLRWLDILGLTALCGALGVRLLVMQPARWAEGDAVDRAHHRIRVIIWLALGVSVLGLDVGFGYHLTNLYGGDFAALGDPAHWVTVITTTRYGTILILRSVLTVLIAGWLIVGLRGDRRVNRKWLPGLLIALGLLATLSLNSHAAANPLWSSASIIVDWAHLVAVSAWVGGLLTLTVILPLAVPAVRREVLVRFSALASFSVGVLALTGLYSATLSLHDLTDLWTSDYGRWLLLKLALIGVMLLIGLANNLALAPRRAPKSLRRPTMPAATESAPDTVGRRIVIESILGIVVLLSVGFLTSAAPPTPNPVIVDRTLTLTRIEGDLTVALRITPNTPGQNTYGVTIKHGTTPLTNASSVRARFVFPALDLISPWRPLAASTERRYLGTGLELSALGEWRIQLDIQTDPDSNAVRLDYPWTVASALISLDPTQPRPINTLALALLSAGLVFLIWPRLLTVLRGKYGRAPEYALLGGLGILIVGSLTLVLVSGYVQAQRGEGLPTSNPIPADTASVVAGQTLYGQLCQRCHGAGGLGDGRDSGSLAVQPANLRTHVPQHTDAELFQFITRGYGAMPAIGAALSEPDRWNVINYLRSLDAP